MATGSVHERSEMHHVRAIRAKCTVIAAHEMVHFAVAHAPYNDGRAVIGGTEDVAEARSVYAKNVGN